MSNLHQHIQLYIKNRHKFQAQLQGAVNALNIEIDLFNQTIQAHQDNINMVKEIVESCSNQTATIDRKLDKFIEHYHIKMRFKINALDDAFKQPEKEDKQSRGFFAKLFGGGNNE